MARRNPFDIDVSHVDRAVDAAIDDALSSVRDVESYIHELEANEKEYVVTTHDLERMKVYVTNHANTPEWRHVLSLISAGELTWEFVITDRGATDAGVAAAYESLVRVPPLDEDGMRRLADEFTAAISAPTPPTAAPDDQPQAERAWHDHDEDFDQVDHWRA